MKNKKTSQKLRGFFIKLGYIKMVNHLLHQKERLQ